MQVQRDGGDHAEQAAGGQHPADADVRVGQAEGHQREQRAEYCEQCREAESQSAPPFVYKTPTQVEVCQSSRRSAATGRWSLPVRGSTQASAGSTPRTRMWSIRAIGKRAGQENPKP